MEPDAECVAAQRWNPGMEMNVVDKPVDDLTLCVAADIILSMPCPKTATRCPPIRELPFPVTIVHRVHPSVCPAVLSTEGRRLRTARSQSC